MREYSSGWQSVYSSRIMPVIIDPWECPARMNGPVVEVLEVVVQGGEHILFLHPVLISVQLVVVQTLHLEEVGLPV